MLAKVLFALLLCASALAVLPNQAQINALVAKHNEHRASVNPPASPALAPLSWHAAAATSASNYAEQCVYQHSTTTYGENLYAAAPFSGENVFVTATNSWNSERFNYTYSTNFCTLGTNKCGHYTQIAWQSTTGVGCGVKNCTTGSPFGASWPNWTYVVCQYNPAGNMASGNPLVINRPYTISSCNPACPSGQYCNSGSCVACTNPCTSTSCGTLVSPTCPGFSFTCPVTCSSGQTCTNNVCTTPSCNTAAACSAAGKTCGLQTTSCGANTNCGTCPSGQTCSSAGQCVTPTCSPACLATTEVCNTATLTCNCAPGYVRNGANVCVLSPTPNWSGDFSLTTSGGTVTFPDTTLKVTAPSGSVDQVVKFVRSTTAVNDVYMKVRVEVIATAGSAGIVFRHGQTGFPNDGLYLQMGNIGTSAPTFKFNRIKGGASTWTGTYNLPAAAYSTTLTTLEGVQSKSGSTYYVNWATFTPSFTFTFNISDSISNLPASGGPAFVVNPGGSSGTVLRKVTISSATVLAVSLFNCVNTADWTTLFYATTGANPATTSVQVRAAGQNANCKAAGAKEAASAMTVVIESSAIATDVLASQFITAVESGSAAVAPLAVKSVSVVGGAEGAALAGFTFGATVAPGAGAGGAGAGLSGGAIAGIVIGSVAGAVLIVGVTTIVVAAVVVAAVVVASKASSDDDSAPTRSEQPAKRGSIRNTLYNVFRGPRGGVDVMNNPSGHQSITARSPQQNM